VSRPRSGRASRHLVLVAALLLGTPIAAVGAVSTGLNSLPPQVPPSTAALDDIPPDLLGLYQQAASVCPGLPWPVLAGIGKVESDHNRPRGQVSPAGAQGPMQFLPTTWTQYGLDGNNDGRPDPFDPADAIPAAANYLCAHGAVRDLGRAVGSYFCGALPDCLRRAEQPGGYTSRVLHWAQTYSGGHEPAGPRATHAVQVALAQVGTPYRWGGETPGVGFDCSGLVQHAYATAGLQLPRTAQTQYNAGPHLPAGTPLQPGDLVFFGRSATRVTHVGIALGQGRMVDAPRTGALVRVEPIAGFGRYLGATRPTATHPDTRTGR
jgi:cell wall-associated NlpC family hydrolase